MATDAQPRPHDGKVGPARGEPGRAEAEMLRRALVDLQQAERAYIESYAAWAHGPGRSRAARQEALEAAERRVDEARHEASLREAALRARTPDG